MKRYKKNLDVIGNVIYSYNTPVGNIDFESKTITVDKYYSQTTSKHINYVARELDLQVIKAF